MNVTQRGILQLIRSAITGQAQTLPEGFSLVDAYQQVLRHQVVGLVYEGAVLCGLPKADPIMSDLFQRYCQVIMRSNAQLAQLEALYSAFDEAHIDYLPLKGCELKSLYPQQAMRVMGDADILIRVSQRDEIEQLMQRLGYTLSGETSHEWVWDNQSLHLELHKQLIGHLDKDYGGYLLDGWHRAVKVGDCRYRLSCEDSYIYQCMHMIKHYRRGGIGLRQPLDLWVYRRHYPNLDEQYLRQEFEKTNLWTFYGNLQRMLGVWFDDAQPDDKTLFMTNYIFSSGSWGTKEHANMARGYLEVKASGSVQGGKRKMLRSVLFPPASFMKRRYPILEKAPWLCPLLWPVRWVTALLFRRSNIRKCQQKVNVVTSENIESFEQALEYVGLEYRV